MKHKNNEDTQQQPKQQQQITFKINYTIQIKTKSSNVRRERVMKRKHSFENFHEF